MLPDTVTHKLFLSVERKMLQDMLNDLDWHNKCMSGIGLLVPINNSTKH